MGFRLLNYTTNTQQLPSTTGNGYMNTDNYEQFGRASSTTQTARFETHTFTLDPSDTGFYVALQDTGTCVGISRLRVYHYICPSQQKGLVLYPEIPTPVSGSVNVQFTCVDNAHLPESESDTITCYHNATWSTEVPVCECSVGYENMGTNCAGKSVMHKIAALLLLYIVSHAYFIILPSVIHTACSAGKYRLLFCSL